MRNVLGIAAVLVALAIINILAVEWSRPSDESLGRGTLREFNDPAEFPVLVPKDDSGVRIPTDLEDAFAELEKILAPEVLEGIRSLEMDEAYRLHLNIGMWLRHNWKLWDWGDGERSRLRTWFNERGVYSGDDMSEIILDNFLLRQHGEPLVAEERMAAIRKVREASWGPKVDFPRTGTIGPTLDGLDFDHRFLRFTADAKGRLFERGQKYIPERLLEHIYIQSDAERDMEHPEQPSEIGVLIRADRAAPWSATRTLLDACAHGAARVYRVFFAVKSETDGQPGTLATFLPMAFAPQDHPRYKKRELPGQVQVNLSLENGSPPSLAGLFGALFALDPAWKSVPAMVRPADDVPTETALRAFDLLLRAGARWAFFGPAPDAGTPAGVSLNGVPCVAGDDPFAPPPMTRSKHAVGVVDPPPLDSPGEEGR